LDNDLLAGNSTRTVYTGSGLDWRTTPQETLGLGVQVYISRADRPVPRNLLGVSVPGNFVRGTLSPTGDQVFPLDPNQINASPAASQAALKNVRVVVDPAAGSVRFSIDTRLLYRLLTGAPSVINGQAAPDPEITADYTPGTMRLTRSDYGASGGAMTLTRSVDASWFRQFVWKQTHAGPAPYIEGQADRLWVTWRRQAGAIGAGPGLFYKVFRPGVRVSRDRIAGFANFNVTDLTAGGNVIPEEVDPNRGMIYFPESLEGHQVRVTYQAPPQNGSATETHYIAWRPETDEVAVPMDTSVNEGTADAFATYEQVPMTNLGSGATEAVPHLEKIWLFWTSNRGTATQASDIFFATIAPRIGPFPDTPDPLFALAASGATFASRRGALPATVASRPPISFIPPAILRRGPMAPPQMWRGAGR